MTDQPTIQRYELVWAGQAYGQYQEMERDKDGNWVEYCDHLAALARAEKLGDEAIALLARSLTELGKYHFSEDGEYNNDTTMELSDIIAGFLTSHHEPKDKS